jgi:hypothetical protein
VGTPGCAPQEPLRQHSSRRKRGEPSAVKPTMSARSCEKSDGALPHIGCLLARSFRVLLRLRMLAAGGQRIIGIPPHLSLPGRSIPAAVLVHGHHALGHIESATKEEGHMCPVCIASTAVMVAGAGSTGGILAVCIGRFRRLFASESSRSVSENAGEMRWQQAKRATTGMGISR